jgi:hypothetical protein
MIIALITYVGGETSIFNWINAMMEAIRPEDDVLETALQRLAPLPVDEKKHMLAAAWSVARADGTVTRNELHRLQMLCTRLLAKRPAVAAEASVAVQI